MPYHDTGITRARCTRGLDKLLFFELQRLAPHIASHQRPCHEGQCQRDQQQACIPIRPDNGDILRVVLAHSPKISDTRIMKSSPGKAKIITVKRASHWSIPPPWKPASTPNGNTRTK